MASASETPPTSVDAALEPTVDSEALKQEVESSFTPHDRFLFDTVSMRTFPDDPETCERGMSISSGVHTIRRRTGLLSRVYSMQPGIVIGCPAP